MQNIETLREHLFAALAGLKDGSIDIDRAKAMSDIGQTIINTAKVEVDYAKVVGDKGSDFLTSKQTTLPNGVIGITQHRIK